MCSAASRQASIEHGTLLESRQKGNMFCCQKSVPLPLHAADLIPEGLLCQLLVHLPHLHDIQAQDVAELAQPRKLTLISLNHHCRQESASEPGPRQGSARETSLHAPGTPQQDSALARGNTMAADPVQEALMPQHECDTTEAPLWQAETHWELT